METRRAKNEVFPVAVKEVGMENPAEERTTGENLYPQSYSFCGPTQPKNRGKTSHHFSVFR
jgi:hypothetical protein